MENTTIADHLLNETIESVINITESLNNSLSLIEPTLTKLEKFTNELTYLIFDNQIINKTIGSSNLSQFLLISIAILTIVLGSYASIEQPSNALPPSEEHPLFDQTDKDCKPSSIDNQMTTNTVLILPVFAGITLLSAYYFIKNYDKVKISNYLNKYIITMSFSSSCFVLSFLFNSIIRKICYLNNLDSMKINKRYSLTISNDKEIHPLGLERELMELPDYTEREKIIKEEKLLEIRSDIKKENQLFNFYFTTGDIFGLVFGLTFTILFTYFNGSKNWILNNFLGFSIVVMGISKTKIPSFKIASLFLTLFFFYDIYFVFGTDVMVSVATNIEIPAKLLMPNKVSKQDNQILTSMLGLGDLALPGSFISLCLRFDLFKFHEINKNFEFHHLQKFEKTYFYASLIGYILSLILTCKIVEIYKVGQPALLYLCPGVMISVFSTALYNGDFWKLWNYDETPISNDDKENNNDKKEILDIICSKETLFLSSEIAPEDIDDTEDHDYEYIEEGDEEDDDLEDGEESETL